MTPLTRHANVRSQQRGIPPLVVDLLVQFGSSVPAGAGTSKLYFGKADRRRLCAYVGTMSRVLEEHLDVYAVIASNGEVITVAHRLERIRHH